MSEYELLDLIIALLAALISFITLGWNMLVEFNKRPRLNFHIRLATSGNPVKKVLVTIEFLNSGYVPCSLSYMSQNGKKFYLAQNTILVQPNSSPVPYGFDVVQKVPLQELTFYEPNNRSYPLAKDFLDRINAEIKKIV